MKPWRKILVGVDGGGPEVGLSQGSRVALQQASRIAQRIGAELHALHAVHPDGEHDPAPVEALRAEFEALALPDANLEVVEERPWAALTRMAGEGRADLVVVAKRNQVTRSERRLGSVSQELLRNCPGPVWVVRPDHELHHQHVVVATDLSPVGDLATEIGAFFAKVDETRLSVVHAWQESMTMQLTAARATEAERVEAVRSIVEPAREHIAAIPGYAELEDRARTYVTRNSASRAILEAVDQLDPDLVVMGTLSRSGIPGLVIGNTAEKLLRKLDPSILAVKPADFVSPAGPWTKG